MGIDVKERVGIGIGVRERVECEYGKKEGAK